MLVLADADADADAAARDVPTYHIFGTLIGGSVV